MNTTHKFRARWLLDEDHAWTDFIIYTTKGLSIERLYFDKDFLEKELLPKLVTFCNCLAPEILHPMHAIGLRVRNLSK